jgi:hypothetical protein
MSYAGLYDRDGFFDHLLARLVGLAFTEEPRHIRIDNHRDVPAVLITGGRGMGKSVLLRALQTTYGNLTPVALYDIADMVTQERANDGWKKSPLATLLAKLSWDLQSKPKWGDGLRFPRLWVALVAITTPQSEEELNRDQAPHEARVCQPERG